MMSFEDEPWDFLGFQKRDWDLVKPEEQERRKAAYLENKARARAEGKARIEQLLPQFEALRDSSIETILTENGIASTERKAQWDLVPEGLRKAWPTAGSTKTGFGLLGTTGIGKTFALAAWLRNRTSRMVDRAIEDTRTKAEEDSSPYEIQRCISSGRIYLRPYFLWVSWPGEIARQRGRIGKDFQGVEDWITEDLLNHSLILILDDVGADRQTAGDWAGEVLGRVVDERFRQESLTIWTSNFTPQDLAERYGARLYSRLQALAPPIQTPKLPDLRLRGGKR